MEGGKEGRAGENNDRCTCITILLAIYVGNDIAMLPSVNLSAHES